MAEPTEPPAPAVTPALQHEELAATFTNDSAMMIAFERALETKRGADALFQDPFAEAMAGPKGAMLSELFGGGSAHFGLPEWPDFHKTWTAVRTRFIDDQIQKYAGGLQQLVNLGAGMDTRAYRLEAYKAFPNGCFDVDMASVNREKRIIFEEVLQNPAPKCKLATIDLDFLGERSLQQELAEAGFAAEKPSLFVAEGLIMYLGPEGKFKLISDVSAVAAPGSVWVLQFLDPSEGPAAETPQAKHGLTEDEARKALTENGWRDLNFWKFGEEGLNFDRFPLEKFKPCAGFMAFGQLFAIAVRAGFSFAVAVKA